jgi:hypothetical protein
MHMMQKKPNRDAQTFTIKALRDHSHARIIGNSFHKRAISPSMSFPGFTLTQHHYYQSLLTPCTYKKNYKKCSVTRYVLVGTKMVDFGRRYARLFRKACNSFFVTLRK